MRPELVICVETVQLVLDIKQLEYDPWICDISTRLVLPAVKSVNREKLRIYLLYRQDQSSSQMLVP